MMMMTMKTRFSSPSSSSAVVTAATGVAAAAAMIFFVLLSTTTLVVAVNPNNQPTELVSQNGLLEVTLTVDDLVSVQDTKIAPAYNDEPYGPTLRVKAGDTLRVTLINNLPAMTSQEQELYNYIQDPQNEIDNLVNVTAIYNRLDITNGNV